MARRLPQSGSTVPGLLGVVGRTHSPTVVPRFQNVFAAMNRGGRLVTEKRTDPQQQWALGRVHLGAFQPEPQLSGNGPVHVLFHGELDNTAELQATLAETGQPPANDAPSLV